MSRSTRREDTLLGELSDALDAIHEGPSTVTSIRQPEGLRRAVQAAVALGWAKSANEGTVDALRDELVVFCRERAMEAHFREHPQARPTLAGVAIALAELDHDPLADAPELIHQAAEEIVLLRPHATPDEVLVWAASLQHSRGT